VERREDKQIKPVKHEHVNLVKHQVKDEHAIRERWSSKAWHVGRLACSACS
jgi:hypothetical protein